MKKCLIVFFLMIIIVISGCNKKESEMVEKIYKKGFSQYILENLELEKYDKLLTNDKMNYIPNDNNHMTNAQMTDYLNLTYIYLRNDIHTERLTKKERVLLAKEENSNLFSQNSMDLIINTYPDIISAKKIDKPEDKEIVTSYDSKLPSDFVTVNSLVLVIGTMSEFDENGNYVDKKHEKEKKEELDKFCKKMEEDLNGKLGEIPIRILYEK